MSNQLDEQLSALADDELPEEEASLLLRRFAREPALVDTLGRYYTMRAAVHGELGPAADGAFAARVAAALDEEPALTGAAPRARGSRLLARVTRPVAGLAVAASVAVVAVGLWPAREGSTPAPGGAEPAVVADAGSASAGAGSGSVPLRRASSGESTASAGAEVAETLERLQWRQLDPSVQRRLNGFLVNHSENAAGTGPGGMLNYARIAGHARGE
ncbi:RseA family anti-sigma factor [Arhodomonas sp. SL1]|uniref:RseA family anti-sigma factor n=1 Tax=Arhodomonas sp. SL1 TaxID=3425691 RepID=UPI003F880499